MIHPLKEVRSLQQHVSRDIDWSKGAADLCRGCCRLEGPGFRVRGPGKGRGRLKRKRMLASSGFFPVDIGGMVQIFIQESPWDRRTETRRTTLRRWP